MHHPESAGDPPGSRKMAHPAIYPRRGSNTGVGSVSALTTVMQSQGLPSTGAQMKKKSGFQITSVTPAQISVSTNNSIAEDTESYDDLDESHTEDLSSSEILDVSLSRATDMGGPERSSSEETLSNLHDAETPSAVSPNQPPHPLPQAPQHSNMVNGTVHHHPYHGHNPLYHGHHNQQVPTTHTGVGPPSVPASGVPLGGAGVPAAVSSASGAVLGLAQKLPASVGAVLENACAMGSAGFAAQPVAAVVPGAAGGMLSAAAGANISVVNPLTSNVSNVNVLSSASMPGLGGASVSGGGLSSGLVNLNSSSGGVLGSSGQNVTLIQQQSGAVSSTVAMKTVGTSVTAPAGSSQIGAAGAAHPPATVVPAPVPQSQMQAPAAAGSRFRVVKLDSSSEPFKKGRWTCTEYYDKDTPAPPAPASEGVPSHRVVESLRQSVSESVACSERESTSGSSVSSSVSTLSHYSESVGSGEMGGSSAQQVIQPQDYVQVSLPGPPQSTAQPHAHPQEVVTPLQKTGVASVPVTIGTSLQQAPVNQCGLQTPVGQAAHGMPQQQVAYSHGAQPTPVQAGYPPAQQPAAPAPAAPTHIVPVSQGPPSDFAPHQPVIQAAMPTVASGTTHVLPHMPGGVPTTVVSGNCQMMATRPPLTTGVPTAVTQHLHQGLMQQQQGPSPQIAQPSQGVVLPQMLPGNVPGLSQPAARTQKPPTHNPPAEQQQQQQPPATQGLLSQPPSAIVSGQAMSSVPPGRPADSQSSLARGGPPVQNGSASAHPSGVGLALGHGALPPVSALYASLPSLTATQLEDAQRLLFQHQSLLSLPKLSAGQCASEAGASLGRGEGSGVNALPASASLFPLKSLPLDGEEDSSSGASVVAIDNKIEQAMDLVKSHLMYAVREEVEVLKEQIKELIERNSQLEQENNLLKNLASPEQLAQFQAQVQSGSPPASTQAAPAAGQQPAQAASQSAGPSA
ncbi:hypothetical protein AAFF_G00334460 [Aldrovandia affinis]|uniref:TSC22 domain family protein 1 n=1 Tax=Aldrovandia affinis TaxID=143900 RepID=A0AAD7SLT7_9TELE|nr:hypothetical protein AAFF_G00334460 [Aldrovandia affinis]